MNNTNFKNIKYLLWDNDGILVDTEYLYYQASKEILAKANVELNEEHFKEHSLRQGQSVFDVAKAKDFSMDQCNKMRDQRDIRYTELLQTEDIIIPNTNNIIKQLAEKFKMAIVSSSHKDNFYIIHKRTQNMLQHFEFELLSGDYPRSKPFPDPWQAAMQRLGAKPEECLVIEDSPRGIDAAHAAGIKVLAVKYRYFSKEEIWEYLFKDDLFLNDISELGDLLLK